MGLRRLLRRALKYKEPSPFLNISYSQEGEDLILGRVFESKASGFFVDVGALHPVRFSNTYKFYELGWNGINIDATPGSMELFTRMRPRDVNLEVPISDTAQTLPYYIFNEPALNTFSKELADERNGKDIYKIEKVVKIRTQTLGEVLKAHVPPNTLIDFLTVDVEGFDLKALKSNDWKLFRPTYVLTESELPIAKSLDSELVLFMHDTGYDLFARTANTSIFKQRTDD